MLEINEVGTVGERIMQLINHFASGNKTSFGRAAGLQSGLLAGIVGSRQSKPSFEVLQKILTGYPSVSPDWLLFGRGSMLRGEGGTMLGAEHSTVEPVYASLTDEQWQEVVPKVIDQLANSPDWKELVATYQVKGKALAEAEYRAYAVANKYPHGKKTRLSYRLGITEEQARDLVVSGTIRSRQLDSDEGVYIVAEQYIREYLNRL